MVPGGAARSEPPGRVHKKVTDNVTLSSNINRMTAEPPSRQYRRRFDASGTSSAMRLRLADQDLDRRKPGEDRWQERRCRTKKRSEPF